MEVKTNENAHPAQDLVDCGGVRGTARRTSGHGRRRACPDADEAALRPAPLGRRNGGGSLRTARGPTPSNGGEGPQSSEHVLRSPARRVKQRYEPLASCAETPTAAIALVRRTDGAASFADPSSFGPLFFVSPASVNANGRRDGASMPPSTQETIGDASSSESQFVATRARPLRSGGEPKREIPFCIAL